MSEVDEEKNKTSNVEEDKPVAKKERGRNRKEAPTKEKDAFKLTPQKDKSILPFDISLALSCFILLLLSQQVYHSTLLAGEAYASPSIIMSSRGRDGSR